MRRDRRKRRDQFLRSSVFVFVGGFAGDVFEEGVVVGRFADDVFFAGPVAEVEKFAAFAAERKFRVGVGVRRLLADGTAEFHAVKNTAKARRCAGVVMEISTGKATHLAPCAQGVKGAHPAKAGWPLQIQIWVRGRSAGVSPAGFEF